MANGHLPLLLPAGDQSRYLTEPDPAYPAPPVALSARLLAALLVFVIVGVGIYPNDMLALARAAVGFLS